MGLLAGCGGNTREISPASGYNDTLVLANGDVYTVDGYQGNVPVYGPPYNDLPGQYRR